MTEHSFPLESLIGGWYIPEKVCDDLINYFEDNKDCHLKTNTIVGKKDVVDDTRMTLAKYNKPKPFENYLTHLDKCLNMFKKKYNDFDKVKSYGINERINIQYYKPGGGYKISHFENNGDGIKGKRYLTFMTYLNNVPNGGTKFKYQELTTPAIKGLTLIWPAYVTHVHKGEISMTNEKYIITGWFSFYE